MKNNDVAHITDYLMEPTKLLLIFWGFNYIGNGRPLIMMKKMAPSFKIFTQDKRILTIPITRLRR